MYTRRTYKASELFLWTRFDTLRIFFIITLWVLAYYFLDIAWLQIPWTPIALIGTAVAFIIGFQNNAAYDRIWEGRKIWGGIVNTSRSLGMFLQDMITNEHAKEKQSDEVLKEEVKTLTYRHIAWMTALRHAMRVPKQWETTVNQKTNQEWGIRPPEHLSTLEDDLKPYLSKEDMEDLLNKDNKQTALLYQQSHHLRKLKESGLIWEFSFLELEGVLKDLFDLQGKSERIKNFPYPRQFATLNHYFMWILLLFLPVALVPQFMEIGAGLANSYPMIGNLFIWFAIPVYTAVGWVFHTMERIGRTGDNPFEGTSNDVPISTIARGIEIDLRQNLGEAKADIPEQFEAKFNVQF
ncbi:putative membrane protein [Ekhidna lutea]|uniref:Putative membrane protein n=1 Tax=Ekhidna lutea TaxID=447679 RepID=A0A239HA36_EKHLU|nr:bestrophin family ion channel [Ekhidna lutea]SNS78132.1 putative membrane protein [Ekhidna lutea]